jgi:hypothetical protein
MVLPRGLSSGLVGRHFAFLVISDNIIEINDVYR